MALRAEIPGVNRPLFDVLAQVSAVPGRWAVIGGLAVWCQLGAPHRPTLDLDAVAGPEALAILQQVGEPAGRPSRRLVDEVLVELIEVDDPGDGMNDLAPKDRLFVAAHWAAVVTAELVEVVCADDGITVPVASRAALVACKLHAWLDRSDQRADKRGGDGLDAVLLLAEADWDHLTATIWSYPPLAENLRWAASTVLVDQAARVAHLIGIQTEASPPERGHVANLGSLLIDACR